MIGRRTAFCCTLVALFEESVPRHTFWMLGGDLQEGKARRRWRTGLGTRLQRFCRRPATAQTSKRTPSKWNQTSGHIVLVYFDVLGTLVQDAKIINQELLIRG